MKKIILIGRSECGKTTLTQRLRGNSIEYHKTHYINYYDCIIDTPGEYVQTRELGRALILYSFEADVVGLLLAATEPYSLYSPNITGAATRDVTGIVTQIDRPNADVAQAVRWLELTGVSRIFCVSAVTGEGVDDLVEYLYGPEMHSDGTETAGGTA